MLNHFERVLQFNFDAGNPIGKLELSEQEWDLEGSMLLEEMEEYLKAIDWQKKVKVGTGNPNDCSYTTWQKIETLEERRQEIADGAVDMIYVLMGTLGKLGIDFDKAMDEVCRSNESKYVEGQLLRNDAGKIMKGPNYAKPDLVFAQTAEDLVSRYDLEPMDSIQAAHEV